MTQRNKTNTKKENLDKYMQELQELILKKIKKKYSKAVIDHWQNPRNFRKLENPDGYASVKGSCGDTMEMFIKMNNDRISECGFQTDGCGTTIVCGSVATTLAQDRTLIEALAGVSANVLLKRVDGLPVSDVHCAELAAETLRRALADYLYQKKIPWKKSCKRS